MGRRLVAVAGLVMVALILCVGGLHGQLSAGQTEPASWPRHGNDYESAGGVRGPPRADPGAGFTIGDRDLA